ncbi:MAG: hypothetical protein ACI909_001075 [Planctomycetota bacterium]|jgi:uncharacterized protein (TIGR02118 family)
MSFVHFIYIQSSDASASLSVEIIPQVREIILTTPGLTRGLFNLPAQAHDYYTDDGPSPCLALQLYYADLETLEQQIGSKGHLQKLDDPILWTGLPGLRITHQVMYARDYSLDNAVYHSDREPPCSYLVHYPGKADDFNAWLNYYLDYHPQILRTFPGCREMEVYTRVDWRDALSWERVNYMQRNRLIFDSANALEAALNSDFRHKSRADFEKFPSFTGSNIHFPMLTEDLNLSPNGVDT